MWFSFNTLMTSRQTIEIGELRSPQSEKEFQKELAKIQSKDVREKVKDLFDGRKIKGTCLKCRTKNILVDNPVLVVGKTTDRGRTVFVKGKCKNPKLSPDCPGRVSVIVKRDPPVKKKKPE